MLLYFISYINLHLILLYDNQNLCKNLLKTMSCVLIRCLWAENENQSFAGLFYSGRYGSGDSTF